MYQALYRRYRPKSFDELLGQSHITTTLRNQIQKENIETAYQEGVSFLMGSDCGVIDHGRNLGELKYLVDVGLSPLEAIQAGTIEGAKFFNQENDLGSIEEGKIADMIIVKENPIDKIGALADNDNVLTVIKDGEILKHKPIF